MLASSDVLSGRQAKLSGGYQPVTARPSSAGPCLARRPG